jgi:hypothetical protein
MDRLLADNMPWIARRVESIHILDRQGEHRRISLDLDMNRLRELAGPSSEGAEGYFDPSHGWEGCRIPIPLGWMPKGLLLDLNITGPDGRPMSLWTRDRDSQAACGSLVALADADLSEPIRQKLFDICYQMPSPQDCDAVLSGARGAPPMWSSRDLPADDQTMWSALTSRGSRYGEAFTERLLQFTTNFLPIVEIPADLPSAMVKYEFTMADPDISWLPGRTLHNKLGRDAYKYMLTITGAMEAQREHLSIYPPPGVEIAGLPGLEAGRDTEDEEFGAIASGKVGRATPECARVYRNQHTRDRYNVVVALRPRLDGFAWPAFIALLPSLFIFALLLASHTSDLQRFASFVALGVSPLAGLLAAREQEFARAHLLVVLRGIVMVTAALALAVAVVSIGYGGFAPEWLRTSWKVMCVLELAVMGLLGWVIYVTSRARAIVRANSHLTLQLRVDRQLQP